MKVALASQNWSSPMTSMYSYSNDVLHALRSVGVDAAPLPISSLVGMPVGGLLLPLARRTFLSYPNRDGALVHHIDQDAWRGVDVVTVHDLYPFRDTRFADRFIRSAIRTAVRRARRIVTDSRATMDELAERFPAATRGKMQVVPIPHAPVTAERRETRYDALWIGRNAPNKRLEEYVALAGRFPRARFAVRWSRSPGRPQANEALTRSISEAPNIQNFTQFLDESQMDELYRSTRIYVSTSTYEGWHIPVMAAYLRGCHIVLPRIEPYLSVYPEPTAFWYDPASRSSLDEAFEGALSTPFHPPSERVAEYVSYASVGSQLRSVYEELAAR